MALTTSMANSYKQELFSGIHLAADTYKLVLIKAGHTGTYNASNTNGGTPGTGTPSATNIGTDEVAPSGSYTSGGLTLTGFSVTLQGTTACLDFTTPSATSATISAVGGVIINTSKANRVVGCFDFGGTITSTAGTFTCTMPAAGAATSLLRIA